MSSILLDFDWGWLFKYFGPLLLAVVFFIWRDFKREDKLSKSADDAQDAAGKARDAHIESLKDQCEQLGKRVESLEKKHDDVIMPMVRQYAEVIPANTKVLERVERLLDS